MRFKVYGAKRDTGESAMVTVDAATAAEASVRANRHGLLVERCEPTMPKGVQQTNRRPGPVAATPPATISSPRPGKAKRILALAGLVVGVAAIALIALFYLKIKPEHEALQKTLADAAKQMDDTAKKQSELDAAQLRRVRLKAKLIKTHSDRDFVRLLNQLDFTDAAKDFARQAGELRDQTRAGPLSATENARRLAGIEKAYASLQGQKLDSSDRDYFDKSMQTAIAKYREAQNALDAAAQHPELKTDYDSAAASAWKTGAEELSSALFAYRSIIDELEKP